MVGVVCKRIVFELAVRRLRLEVSLAVSAGALHSRDNAHAAAMSHAACTRLPRRPCCWLPPSLQLSAVRTARLQCVDGNHLFKCEHCSCRADMGHVTSSPAWDDHLGFLRAHYLSVRCWSTKRGHAVTASTSSHWPSVVVNLPEHSAACARSAKYSGDLGPERHRSG